MRLPSAAIWLLLLPILMLTTATGNSQPSSVREADAKCAPCHAEIYRKYLATPMANASGLAAEQLHPTTFVHQASGVEYKLSLLDGNAVLAYRPPHESGAWTTLPLNYFLGSGHLGTTYLYSIENYLFESPVAWYAASGSYDMKPGLAEMQQAPPSLPMQSSCLRCHMSAVQASDSGTINRYQGLPFLHTGITCESCHGDSQQHVLTKGKSKIVNPARLDAERRDSVCISCHLEGDVSVERAGHSPLNYRPGESISTYVAYYVRTGANLTSRGVSEVEQLSQSTCKRVSGDRMSCSSCHDPHFTPSAEQRTAFFRGKCLACHSQPEFSKVHHPENQDCTSCHMGRTGAANIPHVAWTDHRILKLPEGPKTEPRTKTENDFVPIFSPGATDRDRAMAYYRELLEGDQSLEATAWKLLTQQQSLIQNDKEAMDAFGNLAAERGERETAEKAFRTVLQLDPANLTALSNLGTLLAKEGKLNEAIPLLRTAFDHNPDVTGLAMNLARVQCMAGNGPAARSTLSKALVYCPNYEDMRRLLAQTSSCSAAGGE